VISLLRQPAGLRGAQVSIGCLERGRLMADIWTSHGDIINCLMLQMKANNDAHKAMANALTHKEQVLEDACRQLHQKAVDAIQEKDNLQVRMNELEAELAHVQDSAFGQTKG
jgi:chromosome segregation ATPase